MAKVQSGIFFYGSSSLGGLKGFVKDTPQNAIFEEKFDFFSQKKDTFEKHFWNLL
jgi:hypothetical protein